MDSKEGESIIQIDDPEIDVQTIMSRIREGLVEHALDDDVQFPTFAAAVARRRAEGKLKDEETIRFPEELYYQLEQANLNYDQVWVELSLMEDQMPLVGQFITRFKRELHRLVVYYVNMLGERQVTMNDTLVRVLNLLVDSLESSNDVDLKVEDLQRQVAELRTRLERLESRVGSG